MQSVATLRRLLTGVFAAAAIASGIARGAGAQDAPIPGAREPGARAAGRDGDGRAHGLARETVRALAARASGYRLVVSLDERRLWAIIGRDTVLTASVAVGTDSVLDYQGKRWHFRTPRGVRRVTRKDSLPMWVPPEWHYYEVARPRGLVVRTLARERAVTLADGRRIEIRGDTVGVVERDSMFVPLAADEEIILDDAVFMPPLGTRNRQVPGALGRFRLSLGDGYSLHGTPSEESIGQAATHGCIRLREWDIAWLYEFVPVGTRVFIY
ncbi:MAG: L,D-transpeptidase [Gemmatirosa sp.]